jgi:CheY-like chemotaxis protein
VADYLEPMGYAVEAAHNGAQGLKLILGGDYHALILDVMMPQMDGFEVLKQVAQAIRHTGFNAHHVRRRDRQNRGTGDGG